MAFNDLVGHTPLKKWRLNNISIHINFYQNRFINECARKMLFLNSWKDGNTERWKDRKTEFFLLDVEYLKFLKIYP